MNSKQPFPPHAMVALTISATVVLFPSWRAHAEAPPEKPATTWQDLGFDRLPEGFSTDEIPLFAGLNEARGTWSFEGKTTNREESTTFHGGVEITGNPKSGMFPAWRLAWRWPADDPKHAVMHTIIVTPSGNGFGLMLARVDPVKDHGAGKAGIRPTLFQGDWDLERSTLTWSESGLPAAPDDQAEQENAAAPRESFEMVVSPDGKIVIQNSRHAEPGHLTNAKTIVRTGEAPAEPVTLTGKHSFKTAAGISDRRIKPCLPPQATDISLQSERAGHFARYKVAEADFMKFLNGLWEAGKDRSAHKRDDMHGEREPADREQMAERFKAAGWEPLDKAVVYYSPSKASGAMTTYYYDREAGTAYHETGYW